ncbi:hypothetical protein VCHC62B1_1901, partial [Vibrio cholerae HC-62B1]
SQNYLLEMVKLALYSRAFFKHAGCFLNWL